MRSARKFTPKDATSAGAGLHFTSVEWREISAGGDWAGELPEIDRNGLLTGQAVGREPGYLFVADQAVIAIREADAGGWVIDRGEKRAWPPSKTRPVPSVLVYVGGALNLPGASWCSPVDWRPANIIDGYKWLDDSKKWVAENGDEACIVVYGRRSAEWRKMEVRLDELRVVRMRTWQVIGEVLVGSG